MTRKAAVIGAGPGGLAAAMLLASKGYLVDVYEKKPEIGGRTSALQLGEFRFDRGPTFLNMPHILHELFAEAGRDAGDYLELRNIDPMYRLVFEQAELMASQNRERMSEQLERLFPGKGEADGYRRFMRREAAKLEALMPILQNKHDSWLDYLRPRFLKALPELSLTKSLYDCLTDYFTDERLRWAFTFQAKYLGMSPWECPGAFSILSYIEHAYGIYHPIGGVHQVCAAMAKVIEEYGGRIHTDSGVRRLLVRSGRAEGVELENGAEVWADEVIVNADFAHAMTHLLEPGEAPKYSKKKLQGKSYSCSTYMMYLGVNRTYELPHHSILFARDYRRNVEEIAKHRVLSDDPSVYVQNASVTDPTLAPAGSSAIYILAPVPNNTSGIDWEREKGRFRELVLRQVEERGGFAGLSSHIVAERIVTPQDWEAEHYVYEGATFNLAHNLRQMLALRPHNRFESFKNCWLVGGGTHPGSGLPTIMESARITVAGIAGKARVAGQNGKSQSAGLTM